MDPAKKSISDTDDKDESNSDIDKKIDKIKAIFNEEYEKWSSGKQSESSSKHGNRSTDGESSPTPNSSSSINKKGWPEANREETNSDPPDHTIHGFTNEILFLKNFLLKKKESEEFKTLAIVGKYGVGKTTLCKDVFNNRRVKQAYLPRIWVSMYSKKTKVDEDPKIAVVKRILRSLGVEEEMLKHFQNEAEEEKRTKDEARERTEETVEEKVLSRLLSALHFNLIGKKYMIVLDDVWEDIKWNQRLNDEKNQQEKSHLSCGFPKGFGGRVIMTTRDERVAKKIVGEEENLQRLFPRSDTESVWNIYLDAVPTNADDAVAANAGVVAAPNGSDAEAPNGGNAEAVTDGSDAVAKNMKVNPRYPGRFKKELMDKSCGIPLAARMLATIKPVKIDETDRSVDRKKSF